MEQIEDCGKELQVVQHNLDDWSSNENTVNSNSSTLLYIAVEYVKDEYKADTEPAFASFQNFQQHVSTLDPNMSSVARYSPMYNDPVIIQQLVPPDNVKTEAFINSNSSLDNLPTVLCNTDINNVSNQFLCMVNGEVVKREGSHRNETSNKEQEVEIFVTDQATGISYSVSTQELLVQEQELIEALSPNPLLDTELLTIDESTLKNNLPEDLINSSVSNNTESNIVANFISNFAAEPIKDNYDNIEEDFTKLRRREGPDELETEDKLLSRVYSIIDKPIPSRARATLPESYLKIVKVDEEYAVFAKKCLRKRSQFGPVQGILKNPGEVVTQLNKLDLFLVDKDGQLLSLDISDEEHSNWMCFIRKAQTYEEQNLVVSQHENGLYFTVIKNILPKQELKVGYSYLYANRHSLPVLEKEKKEEQWPCYECGEQFPTSRDLENHLNFHEESRKEKVKFRRRLWRSSKRNLMKTAATTQACQCTICQQVFNPPKYGLLKNHLLQVHNIEDKCVEHHFYVVRNYKCEKCNVVFNSETLFKIHNVQHDWGTNDKEGDSEDDETFHLCPACNRKFSTQRQLVLHVNIHSLPKSKRIPERFQCPVCNTTYPMRERLQKHMLVHGPEESKPLQCPQCKKRFMNNSALTCHLKTHFVGQSVYECPICKERFDHVPKLKAHIQKHCIDGTYTCPECNKKFKAYSVIRKHIRAFHSDRKHPCQHCSKIFSTVDKLKTHLLKHSDHREFLCSDCGKQFKRKDKLMEHCKRVHNEEKAGEIPKSKPKEVKESKTFVPRVEPTDFHQFIYKCHHCLIGFKRRGMLVNHLAKRHPDVSLDSVPELNLPILRATRDYYCQYCDKVYRSSSKRKAHILKNHPGAALPISNRKQGAYPEVVGLPNPSFSQTVGSVTTSPQNCNWCHKQYASKAKLLHHQRKEHTEYLDENMVVEPIKPDSVPIGVPILDDKVLTATVMEEFVDDPDTENQFCHLVNVDNDVFQQADNLNIPNSQLYRLLTNTNNMAPPR